MQTYFPSLPCLECSRHDLSNGVLYASFLDVGQLSVSYVVGLAMPPVYLLVYHTHQGSLTGLLKDSW
jgi:hypothetical protein